MKRLAALSLALSLSLTACSQKSTATTAVLHENDAYVKNIEGAKYTSKIFGNDMLTIDITLDDAELEKMASGGLNSSWGKGKTVINGDSYEKAKVKVRGDSTQESTSGENYKSLNGQYLPLRINFGDYSLGKTFYDLDRLDLNTFKYDYSCMKNYISYRLFQYMKVPSPWTTFATVNINGNDCGLYLATESINKSFLHRNYLKKKNNHLEAYKPNTSFETVDGDTVPDEEAGNPGADGGRFGVNLVYTDDNESSYQGIFGNSVTNIRSADAKRVISSLKEFSKGNNIEKYVDIDEILRYTACNVFIVNLDSYLSNIGHNYVLTEFDGKLSMLPWDLDGSFGCFSDLAEDPSTVVNYPIDSIFWNVDASERPLISKLLENSTYKEQYHKYLGEIANGFFKSGIFSSGITAISSIIDERIQTDSNLVSYDDYLLAVENLKKFGELRTSSVLEQLSGNIPSTTEAQMENNDKLVDASGLDLTTLGVTYQ